MWPYKKILSLYTPMLTQIYVNMSSTYKHQTYIKHIQIFLGLSQCWYKARFIKFTKNGIQNSTNTNAQKLYSYI